MKHLLILLGIILVLIVACAGQGTPTGQERLIEDGMPFDMTGEGTAITLVTRTRTDGGEWETAKVRLDVEAGNMQLAGDETGPLTLDGLELWVKRVPMAWPTEVVAPALELRSIHFLEAPTDNVEWTDDGDVCVAGGKAVVEIGWMVNEHYVKVQLSEQDFELGIVHVPVPNDPDLYAVYATLHVPGNLYDIGNLQVRDLTIHVQGGTLGMTQQAF